MIGKVLMVDDDPVILRLVVHELEREGIETVTAATGTDGLRLLEEEEPAMVILDLLLPDIPGTEVLSRMRKARPCTPVVMMTVQNRIEDVVECMSLGASDYIPKPLERTRLLASVRNAIERKRLFSRVQVLAGELRQGEGFAALLGRSAPMRRAVDLLRRAAASEVTVLLEGESGTGKEVAARALHAEGTRRTGPFVALNCGAIPEGLIESELFGHEKGSFTGATASRSGRFEEAEGGTLFLDEIGELRVDLQVRLLRVLQEMRIQRVGGTGTRPVDVRVVAATNRDLRGALGAGAFREDLYYRLAVFPVPLPPLRNREGDVTQLAEEFLHRFCERHRRPLSGFSTEARRALQAYGWPGNVRELENVVERAVIMEDGGTVSLGSLPDVVVDALQAGPAASAAPGTPGAPGEVPSLEEEERRLILRALDMTKGNVQEAALRLGISRATVYRKMERYGLGQGAGRASGEE